MQGFSSFNPNTVDRLKAVLEQDVNKLLEPYNIKLSVEGISYLSNEADVRVKANIIKSLSGVPVLTKAEEAFNTFAKINTFRYGLNQEFDIPQSLRRDFKGIKRIKFTGYSSRQRKFKVYIKDVARDKVYRITERMAIELNNELCKED